MWLPVQEDNDRWAEAIDKKTTEGKKANQGGFWFCLSDLKIFEHLKWLNACTANVF
jgi:hypothetical protein